MKILKMILLLGLCAQTMAFYKSWSLGVGALSESYGKIQTDAQGNTNGLDFTPFFKVQSLSDFFLNHDLQLELATTLPRDSRDSAVNRMNYWFNALMSYDLDFIKIQYGPGMYFTRLSMDGTAQELPNGNSTKSFATPNGSTVAGNLVLSFALDAPIPTTDLTFNSQAMILNPEDSDERAVNILLSLSYKME